MEPPVPAESDYGPTSLPSTGARVAAFIAILVGGACGGLIGYAVTDLQGGSTLVSGIAGLLAAAGCATGVGVVAVLAMRAMGEWRAISAGSGGVRPSHGESGSSPARTQDEGA